MKHEMLDVLLFLFEQVIEKQTEMSADQESLMLDLESAGFNREQIEHAFSWLIGFIKQGVKRDTEKEIQSQGVRIFSEEELERLPPDGLFLLSSLEQQGILSPSLREEVIARALSLDMAYLENYHFNWLLLNIINKKGNPRAASIWLQDFEQQWDYQSIH